ncbi:MAG: multidrug effflux MFS transporter [Burkholderiales bacterium]
MSAAPREPTDSRRPLLSDAAAAFALTLLMAMQPLTTDLYLPTLPQIAADLAAPPAQVQLTMSVMVLAWGIGQLLIGPQADRWGRRPVLSAGLTTYLLASLGAALSQDIVWLIAMRVAQGIGVAAAVVCARAMVRDLFEPVRGAHVMSLAMTGLGLVALCGPPLGGALATVLGWRGVFAVLAVLMAVYLVFFWRRVPETIAARNPQALKLAPLLASWQRIVRQPVFLAFTALSATTYAGVFVFLSGSSFVYIGVLHTPVWVYGLILGQVAGCYVAGTALCRFWLARHGVAGTVRRAGWLTLTGGLSMMLFAALGLPGIWPLLLPQCLYSMGHGIHQPCGQTFAIGPFPREAGTAAALAGFLQASCGFAAGLLIGHTLDGTTRPLAFCQGLIALLVTAVAWGLVQRSAVRTFQR